MRESGIDIWKQKLQWIAEHGDMAFANVHMDYMDFSNGANTLEQYSVHMYIDLLNHLNAEYEGQFWNALPRDVAQFCKENLKKIQEKPNRSQKSELLQLFLVLVCLFSTRLQSSLV